jgi:hypothetical protein
VPHEANDANPLSSPCALPEERSWMMTLVTQGGSRGLRRGNKQPRLPWGGRGRENAVTGIRPGAKRVGHLIGESTTWEGRTTPQHRRRKESRARVLASTRRGGGAEAKASVG